MRACYFSFKMLKFSQNHLTILGIPARCNAKSYNHNRRDSTSYSSILVHITRIGIFTALHEMQTRSSDENSVCLSVCTSVCLSVTRVIPDKMEERSVQIFMPYERTFILVFWEQEWLVGGDPFYVKFCVNRPPLERNRRFSTNNRS